MNTDELDENTAVVADTLVPVLPLIPRHNLAGPPKALDLSLIPPAWRNACASNPQKPPTYIVHVNTEDGTCPDVSTPAGGSWQGCPLVAGESKGYCTYTWTSATPPLPLQYRALESVAVHWNAQPMIVANCSPNAAQCAAQLPAGSGIAACRDEQQCCEWNPLGRWIEEEGFCSLLIPQFPAIPPCDVCGFIVNDKLTAVLPPSPVNAPHVLLTSGEATWQVSPPHGKSVSTTTIPEAGTVERVVIEGDP